MIFICGNCWKNRKKPPKIRTLTNFVPHGILIDPISGYRTHDIPTESQALAPRQSWILDSTPWILDSRYSCTRFQSLSVKFEFWILIVREVQKLRILDSTTKKFFIRESGFPCMLSRLTTPFCTGTLDFTVSWEKTYFCPLQSIHSTVTQ